MRTLGKTTTARWTSSEVPTTSQKKTPPHPTTTGRNPVSASHSHSHRREQHLPALLAATAAGLALMMTPMAAMAVEETAMAPAPSKALPETIYFGSGCFWGRQKEFVDAERDLLGRSAPDISAVVGYAGGKKAGPDGKVCYYYADPRTVYESLGHAEVVKVDLEKDPEREFKTFADKYFTLFQKTTLGMMRLDPQDAGPGYRNVVGLPGGVQSKYYKIMQEANVNGMILKEGKGNEFKAWGQPTEDDLTNVVWVVDSEKLPFFRAEAYHQFHNGIGAAFPKEYTGDLKDKAMQAGKIGPTGCPELPFYF